MTDIYAGGCQCGAIRFRAEGPIRHASICNCRMCQKALGNLIAPFVQFEAPVVWTRGEPAYFQSSPQVRRGFCRDCGTPLYYRWGKGAYAVAIGALDRPDVVVPSVEYAHDNRHPVFADYNAMVPEALGSTDEERDMLAILKSNQHPDRDTETWPNGS
jgi:hypothetical protein